MDNCLSNFGIGQKMFNLRIEIAGFLFPIVNNWLVRLTRDFISLVNDHAGNNLNEVFVHVYFGSIVL